MTPQTRIMYGTIWFIFRVATLNIFFSFETKVGILLFTLISVTIIAIFILCLLKLYNSMKSIEGIKNPYMVLVTHNSRTFKIKALYYNFKFKHPSVREYEALEYSADELIQVSKPVEELGEKLLGILENREKYPELKFCLIKSISRSKLYISYSLFVYTTEELSHSSQIGGNILEKNHFEGLTKLSKSEPLLKKIRLNDFSSSQISQIFGFDDISDEIIINVSGINNNFEVPTFEVGVHELEMINRLIQEVSSSTQNLPVTRGEYKIGNDLDNRPIYLDLPQNFLYFGETSVYANLLDFAFITDPLLVTDNPLLIKQVQSSFSSQIVEIIDIYDLQINIMDYAIRNPRFFILLLENWSNLLADTLKTNRSSWISAELCFFLNVTLLHKGDEYVNSLGLKDLTSSRTYRNYSRDLSSETSAIYGSLFKTSIFNNQKLVQKTTLQEFAYQTAKSDIPKIRIISLESMRANVSKAIVALLIIMKSLALLPGIWLSISVDTDVLDYTDIHRMSRLDFKETSIHISNISRINYWLNNFSLFLKDQSIKHKQLDENLFDGLPQSDDGISINFQRVVKTVMKIPSW